MVKLKLGKLLDRTPIKLTIAFTLDLLARLEAYAAVYAFTYGVEKSVVDLVPAILAAFLNSDRNFVRLREAAARR